jgi:ferredoxin
LAKIHFLTKQSKYTVPDGSEFLEIEAQNQEIPLKFGCRKGNCGVCAIKIVEGDENLTKKSEHESDTLKRKNLTENYRLACQCALNGDVKIE